MTIGETPEEYAPPIDEQDDKQYVFATATRSQTSVTLSVKVNRSNAVQRQYVYKTGYYTKSTDTIWHSFTFPNSRISNSNWTLDNASYTATISSLSGEEYVIVYVCRKYAGMTEIICGAQGDPPENTQKWTIQSFDVPSPACSAAPDQFCLTEISNSFELSAKNLSLNSTATCSSDKACYYCAEGYKNVSTDCFATCDECPSDGAIKCGTTDQNKKQVCTPNVLGCLK